MFAGINTFTTRTAANEDQGQFRNIRLVPVCFSGGVYYGGVVSCY